MKKLILAAVAASVLATPVLAAPGDGRFDHGRYEQRHDDRRDFRSERRDFRDERRDFRNDRRDFRHDRIEYRRWNRGDRFDYRYARNYRVIDNPRFYHLHDAPRGYRWVQSGNDALLIGLTTGIVASVLAGSIH